LLGDLHYKVFTSSHMIALMALMAFMLVKVHITRVPFVEKVLLLSGKTKYKTQQMNITGWRGIKIIKYYFECVIIHCFCSFSYKPINPSFYYNHMGNVTILLNPSLVKNLPNLFFRQSCILYFIFFVISFQKYQWHF